MYYSLIGTKPSALGAIDREILVNSPSIKVLNPNIDLVPLSNSLSELSAAISANTNCSVSIPGSVILLQSQLAGPMGIVKSSSSESGTYFNLSSGRTAAIYCKKVLASISPITKLAMSFKLLFVSLVSIFMYSFTSIVYIFKSVFGSLKNWFGSIFN